MIRLLLISILLFTGVKNEITLENVEKLDALAGYSLPSINGLSWSSDSTRIAAATQEGAFIIDLITDEVHPTQATENAYEVTFINDDTELFVDFGLTGVVVDTTTFEVKREHPLFGFGTIDPEGKIYAIDSWDNIVWIYDVESVSRLHKIKFNQWKCEYACGIYVGPFSPDGRYLIAAPIIPDYESAIVNVATGEKQVIEPLGQPRAFSPDGSLIASRWTDRGPGYISNRTLITRTETGQVIASLPGYGFGAPAFSRDNRLLVVSVLNDNAPNPDLANGILRFYDTYQLLETGKNIPVLEISFGDHIISTVFSPDFQRLAVGRMDGVSIWGIRE
jgi:WD40 repeat protein